MIRLLVAVASLVLVAACSTVSSVAASCPGIPVTTATMGEDVSNSQEAGTCTSTVAQSRREAAIGSDQRTSGGSRTVGVPPGFLVGMIILLLLVGAA